MAENDEKDLVPSPKKTKTSWKPGQSGNPKGRPSREVEREYLDIMVSKCTPEHWEKIVDRAIHDAEKGDKYARDWLGNHLVGEPAKVHQYLINENRAITIRVVWGDEPRDQIVDGEIRELMEGEEDE